MRFNRRARLDTSQIRDRRGAGRGGFGGGTGGRGMAVGGGVGGLILLVVALLAGVDPTALLAPTDGGGAPAAPGALEACDETADITEDPECRFVAVENSVQDFWTGWFAERGSRYRPATLTAFTGAVSTGCGTASSQVGPFYCPPDEGVYLDLGFFEELRTRLGAQGGDFAEAYVVAHEYGHHVQHLTGQMARVQTREGADSDAVRLELQADCLAGVWAHHAETTPTDDGTSLVTEISEADISEGVDAAETVGDDYIQERVAGTVTPETWTHGSSEQRRRWFRTGLDHGDPARCDTFAVGSL